MESFLPGTEVHARGLRWEVVFTEPLGPQTLVRLRGIEQAVRGAELDLLHPFEPIEPVRRAFTPERPGRLRNWLVYHQSFLLEQSLGAHAFLAAQPGRLRLEPYQLVPVLRAVGMSRPRLFLADGVGLGKTIQAGLVLTELIARRLAHRILIVSPAGPLLEQWRTEMAERFGLRLDVIDRARLEEIRRGSELGANPFDFIPLGLASMEYLKQERVLELLERTNYDAVVIDEAHHCTEASAGERDDTQRRRLAEVLARQSDALLLLTATPHDGYDRSFASLCELLDPSLVNGRGELRGDRYRRHVIRRLKQHIKDARTGEPLFKERIVHPLKVRASKSRHPHFVSLQQALLDLIAPELRQAMRSRRYSDVLSFLTLLKISVSTVASCRSVLKALSNRFQDLQRENEESQESRRQRLRTLKDYRRRLERFGTMTAEEESEQQQLEIEDIAQQLASLNREVRRGTRHLKKATDVVAALGEITNLAEAAESEDPKLERVLDEIGAIRRTEPSASILIYTEYIASLKALSKLLETAGLPGVLTMTGEDDEKTRKQITARFRREEGLILLSTDTAAEGLNLHDRCHHLLHLELPYNPNRLEQRNGRIDRYGQKHNPQVRYLYLAGTFEERILMRLIVKYEKQRARLTFVPNTLGAVTSVGGVSEKLLQGLVDDDTRLFEEQPSLFENKDITQVDEGEGADAATRELLEEIDRSLRGFKDAAAIHSWLGEEGLNAGEQLQRDAGEAAGRGGALSCVDLPRFVCDSLLLDGGNVSGAPSRESFEVTLPPAWVMEADDLPGYDPQSRRVLLTTRLEVTRDEREREVGFLGRAHPLVRRAIDRVRYLSLGASGAGADDRVSAVRNDDARPALLATFLGRIVSRAGRELEQVIAVRLGPDGGSRFFRQADEWLPLADPARGIPTADLWEKHFGGWAADATLGMQETAREGFQAIAEEFQLERRDLLLGEKEDLARWLAQRSEDLTAKPQPTTAFLPGLFTENSLAPHAGKGQGEGPPPPWQSLTVPLERLAAFAKDRGQPPARRSEAEGVIRLYRKRLDDLEARLAFGAPEIVPLGLLMLVPTMSEAARGA